MRVLHVTHRYAPAIGGSENYMVDLSTDLVRRGYQVDVLTSRALDYHTWQNELPAFEQMDGVNIYRYWSWERGPRTYRVLDFALRQYAKARAVRYEPLIFFGNGPLSPGLFWKMILDGERYDLVHLNCLLYSSTGYGYWAAKRVGLPIIVTPHAHAEQPITYNVGYQRRILEQVDHTMAQTSAERDMFIELGLNPTQVSTGGVGLKMADYRLNLDQVTARQQLGLPENGFAILFLGRQTEYKGLNLLLKAYQALRAKGEDVYFVTVGPETEFSKALWPHYANLPDIYRLGVVPHEQKLMALQACDCLAMPSTGEAFGIVFLEAWAMQKPVIGARTRSVSAVIHHQKDGFLIEPDDVPALVCCFEWLIQNPNLAARLGENGYQKLVKQYTLTHIVDRIEAVYQQVVTP